MVPMIVLAPPFWAGFFSSWAKGKGMEKPTARTAMMRSCWRMMRTAREPRGSLTPHRNVSCGAGGGQSAWHGRKHGNDLLVHVQITQAVEKDLAAGVLDRFDDLAHGAIQLHD